jgi:hypothetical protein
MKIKKRLIVAAAVASFAATTLGVSPAHADTSQCQSLFSDPVTRPNYIGASAKVLGPLGYFREACSP